MSLPTPYYHSDRVTLYHGDCLAILPNLGKVDAVVTDPPYGINTKSDGAGKLNPWADLCNSAYWYTAWFNECKKIAASMWAWERTARYERAARSRLQRAIEFHKLQTPMSAPMLEDLNASIRLAEERWADAERHTPRKNT